MRTHITIAAAALAVFLGSALPLAADERPIEIGGGLGAVGSWFADQTYTGGDVRLTFPTGPRGDVEALVAMQAPNSRETLGMYGAQYRHRLPVLDGSLQPFVTFGAVGVFYHERGESMFMPPLLGVVGAGLEQRVARRLAVRVEAQAILAFIIPAGVRVAAGVSIPLGGSSAGGRSGLSR